MTLPGGFLVMKDSVAPANLRGQQADAFGGYGNGWYDDIAAIEADHPGASFVDFSVFLAPVGNGGDFEPGDMPPSAVVPFLDLHIAAGVPATVLYASIGGWMPEVAAAAAARARNRYKLLSAHYGWTGQLPGLERGQHICGPATCGAPIECDGTQWIDRGPYDESILKPDFFAAAPATIPAQPASSAGGAQMNAGQILLPGQSLSANGWVMTMQIDGNLVVRAPGNTARWSSNTNTAGSILTMQTDGNLVVVAPGNHPVWSSGTASHPGAVLQLQADGNAVVYGPGHTPLWSTGT